MTLTEEDKIRIAEYRKTLGRYPKPSVTADIVAVRPTFSTLRDDQWRENPKFSLEILLIKRGQWPYEGFWALPGGFIRPSESVQEGARRELKEETSLEGKTLIPIGVFSDPKRDMRAWIISNAFVSIHRRGEGAHVKGGDDAAEATWLRLASPVMADGRFSLPFYDGARHLFTLTGTYRAEALGGGTITSVNENPLAFDHATIIAEAFLRLISFDLRKLVFFFLPEKFTLADYIGVYQYLTRDAITRNNIPNFRRQLTAIKNPPLVACAREFEDLNGRGHAAAMLYRKRG